MICETYALDWNGCVTYGNFANDTFSAFESQPGFLRSDTNTLLNNLYNSNDNDGVRALCGAILDSNNNNHTFRLATDDNIMGKIFESVYNYLCVKIGVEDCEKAPTLGVYQMLDSGAMEYQYGYVLSTPEGATDVYELERTVETTKGGKYVFVLAGATNWKFASIKISYKEITEYSL